MTTKKAATLSSSLLSRKGDASPLPFLPCSPEAPDDPPTTSPADGPELRAEADRAVIRRSRAPGSSMGRITAIAAVLTLAGGLLVAQWPIYGPESAGDAGDVERTPPGTQEALIPPPPVVPPPETTRSAGRDKAPPSRAGSRSAREPARSEPIRREELVPPPPPPPAVAEQTPPVVPPQPPPVRAGSKADTPVARAGSPNRTAASPAPPAQAKRTGTPKPVAAAKAAAGPATPPVPREKPLSGRRRVIGPLASGNPDGAGSASPPAPKAAAPAAPLPRRKPAPPPARRIGGADYAVQLSSLRSETAAKREVTRLNRRLRGILDGKKLSILRVPLSQRGTVYRIRLSGFAGRAPAREMCARLRASKQDCLVIRR